MRVQGRCLLSCAASCSSQHSALCRPVTIVSRRIVAACGAGTCAQLSLPHGRPGARDLTVVWGCNRGGGRPRANTQSGGDPVSATAAGSREVSVRPTTRRPPWGSHDDTGGAPPGAGGQRGISRPPCGPAHSRACVYLLLSPCTSFRPPQGIPGSWEDKIRVWDHEGLRGGPFGLVLTTVGDKRR